MTTTQKALLAAIREMGDAAYKVLSAYEAATRENADDAAAFATAYPFASSFDEVVGQIGEWRENVALQMTDNARR